MPDCQPLFSPLKLGAITLPSNVIQGPLAGYSCSPFRRLFWQFGGLGIAMSEMISSNDFINRKQKPIRYIHRSSDEPYMGYQIAANDPSAAGQLIDQLNLQQPQLIDLNAGCPVTKIRKKTMGSKLLEDPPRLLNILKTMKENADCAVSLKIRIPGKANDYCIATVLDVAAQAEIDLLTVHGRHWTERYDVDCDLDAIADIVERSHLPVIANGDVDSYQSLQKTKQHTGCHGIMVARAGVGQPWLFKQIQCAFLGKPFELPSKQQRLQLLLEHLQYLKELDGEKLAVLQARKLTKYYLRGLANQQNASQEVQQIDDWAELLACLNQQFAGSR